MHSVRLVALWLLVSLSTWAEPLRLQLFRYEGSEFDLRVEGRSGYYLEGGHKRALKTLSDAELLRLRSALQEARFSQLPAELVNPRCDSFDRVTLGKKSVRATDLYAGPRQVEFKRFRQLVLSLRGLFPLPPPVFCQAELRATPDGLYAYTKLTPRAGWHTYWQHPGESGMATELGWTLPQGFEVGPLEWSLPQRFEHEGIVTYGYESPAWLRQQIRVPERFSGQEKLQLRVSWLCCDIERCLPGHETLELKFPVASTSKTLGQPAPFPVPLSAPARAWRQGGHIWLETHLPEGVVEFFPAQGLLIQESTPPEIVREGNLVRFRWVAYPAPQPLERLKGLLCVGEEGEGRRGFWIDTRMGESTP